MTTQPRRKGIVASFCVLALACAFADEPQWILHEGTPLRMRINRTISSADAEVGENVDFETLDDVKVNDLTVIPKGSTAIGTVTEAVSKRRMGRAGKLNMNIDYVRFVTGEKLALRGVQDVKGGSHTGAMTGAMVATGIVFFPAAPLFLFMHGKDVTIPQGHEITVYTNAEYVVVPSKFAPPAPAAIAAPVAALAPPASAQPTVTAKVPSGEPLTNADVLKMKDAGLGDQLIVDKINSAPAKYDLNTDDLLALKKAGVSDAVIQAMISAAGR
jgi:hypothetical protein